MKKEIVPERFSEENGAHFFQRAINLEYYYKNVYQLVSDHSDGKDIINFQKEDIPTIIKALSKILTGSETDCLKIGELNNLGIEKSYPCASFAKLDQKFTKELWCYNCRKKYDSLPQASMSELDPRDKIHSIIANRLATYMKGKGRFTTMELSEQIYDLYLAEGLVEIALTTRINSIVIDLLKIEYGIEVE